MDETVNITKEKTREIFKEWFQDPDTVPASLEYAKSDEFLDLATEYFWYEANNRA